LLRGVEPLAVTDAERCGDTSRVKPVGLLKFPAYLPGLTGLEPCTGMVRELRGVVRHPSAVAEFAYDWWLPVKSNAAVLADAFDAHLEYWRMRGDRPDARSCWWPTRWADCCARRWIPPTRCAPRSPWAPRSTAPPRPR
jgi:hypothetical protein